ncbi:DNA polymerase III subunit delta [Chloroflexota bacterium]
MLYILSGPDNFSRSEALEEIKRGLGDWEMLDSNTSMLDGRQLTPDQLRLVCQALPFLAEKRLVIVEGLLERFEHRAKPGKQKETRKMSARQNDYKSLVAVANELPDSTVLVLVDGEVKKGNPLYKELLPRAKVRVFPLLRNNELRQWIKKRVAREGGSISPRALDLLARLVGGNLWLMAGEVAKLVLYTPGKCIEEEDVGAVVGYSQQASVFAMVDAILESRAGLGQQALQQLLQAGVAPAYLLFMLTRQVRMLVRTKELIKEGRSEVEIQDRLGITADFVWRKTAEQAGRYSLGRLKELYHRILEADLAIKTGKYNGELALDILVAELCR